MDFTLKGIIYIVFRYKTSLLLFTLYLALGFALFLKFTKKTYESTAEILVRFGQEQLASSSVSAMDSRVYITRREQEIQNEIRILTSADTLMSAARAIAGPGASEKDYLHLREFLSRNLEVSAMKNSDIVTAAFRFPDPMVAQEVLSLIIQQYQIHHSAVYFNANELELVKNKMATAHAEYSDALDKLTQFEISAKLYDNSQILELASNIEAQKLQLNNLRSEYVYTKLKRDKYRETLEGLPKSTLFLVREVNNSLRDDWRARLSELQLQKEGLLSRYQDDSQTVRDLQREIDNLTRLIESEPERLVGERETRPNETWNTINNTVLALSPEVDALEARIKNFEEQITQQEENLVQANRNKSMYALLSRDVELKKDIYDQFYQDYTAAIGKQDAQTNSITNASVIAQPSLKVLPIKPNRRRILALGGALLILGNLFILSVRVFADNTVSTPEQAEHSLQCPVVGTFGGVSRKGLEGETYTKAVAEKNALTFEQQRKSFQQLYIRITGDEKPNVILFTSSVWGEENLALAENFAIFSREYQQRKVALLDYTPAGRHSNSARLSENGDPLPERTVFGVDEYVRSDEIDVAAEKRFLAWLKGKYDLIVVNYNPLQESPTLIALSDTLDWVVYKITAEKTNRFQASRALESLKLFGFSNIGLVLTDRKFHIPAFLYRFL